MKRSTSMMIAVALVALTAGSLMPASSMGAKVSLPTSHMIANIPYHEQLNGLSCGAGSLEMVLDYWGPDIDQKEIMNCGQDLVHGDMDT